jgi:hypothetical protein
MAIKKYRNPNIPKPKPDSRSNADLRYTTQPVKPNPPVRKKGPGGGPKPKAPKPGTKRSIKLGLEMVRKVVSAPKKRAVVAKRGGR